MKYIITSRLREYVNEASLTAGRTILQKEIADATGIRQPTVSAWMNNRKPLKKIDVPVLIALCEWAGCTPLEMLAFEDDEEDDEEIGSYRMELMAVS